MTANFEPIAKITIDHIAGPKQRMYRHVCLTIGDILHRNRGVFGFDQHDPRAGAPEFRDEGIFRHDCHARSRRQGCGVMFVRGLYPHKWRRKIGSGKPQLLRSFLALADRAHEERLFTGDLVLHPTD